MWILVNHSSSHTIVIYLLSELMPYTRFTFNFSATLNFYIKTSELYQADDSKYNDYKTVSLENKTTEKYTGVYMLNR